MKVVLSIGGSVLAPGEGPEQIAAYATAIRDLVDAGCTPGIVVGGGGVAREYIATGRSLGANEIELDDIGIGVTRLNARLLLAGYPGNRPPAPANTYEDARAQLACHECAVMGGTSPGHTTDAVAAALAEYLDAELLVLATSVPGVFDADPNTTEDATQLPELSSADLVDLISRLEMNAGSPAPVDLLAAKLIDRSSMRTIVLDGTDPSALVRAVHSGEHDGTDVLPRAAASTPSLWNQA